VVHVKYKWKNGKRYGPYYYENKRVNGKVVTTYLGKDHNYGERKNVGELSGKKINFTYFYLVIAVFLLVFLFVFYTGEVRLSLSPQHRTLSINLESENYNTGETLKGNILLSLMQGELIPANSKLLVNYNGVNKEINVADNLNVEKVVGDYYLYNIGISGHGDGYGIAGEKEVFSEISFDLIVSSNLGNISGVIGGEANASKGSSGIVEGTGETGNGTQSNGESENVGNESTTSGGETGENEVIDNSLGQGNTGSEVQSSEVSGEERASSGIGNGETAMTGTEGSGTSSGISGGGESVAGSESTSGGGSSEAVSSGGTTEATLSPNEKIISGKASKGNDFVYDIEDGQNVKIISGSVKVNGNSIDEGNLIIKIESGRVIVSTNYSEIEKGFGKEFLGSEVLEIKINIDEFGFIANETGTFNAELLVNNEKVLEDSKDILIIGENVTAANKTILNETLLNKTIINETLTNQTLVNQTIGNLTNVTQLRAVLGRPVKWVKRIDVLTGEAVIKAEVPKSAGKILAKKLDKKGRELEIEDFDKGTVEKFKVEDEEIIAGGNDGGVIIDNNLNETIASETSVNESIGNGTINENIITDINKEGKNINDGKQENESQVIGEEEVSLSPEIVEGKQIDINLSLGVEEVVLEYETPAPYAIEENTAKGKIVNVIGPEDVHYENVLVFTNLSEELNVVDTSKIKIKWRETGQIISVLNANDTNNNGIIDYVEWVAPRLSNQTFDIIVITRAEHLDSNRTFVSDIYEQVKAQDGIWSEAINDGEYVRVTFEIPLDNTRDITLWSRIVSGNPKIEVYEIDKNESVVTFDSLRDNEYNKVLLTGLAGGVSQDTFDLKVVGGAIELDHVIDPISYGGPMSCNQNGSASSTGVKCLNGTLGKREDWTNATIDSCVDQASSPDTFVKNIYLNESLFNKSGSKINVTCEVQCFNNGQFGIVYNNGSGWEQGLTNLASCLVGVSTMTRIISINNIVGTHYARCWVSEGTSCGASTTCCTGTGADNDDVSFKLCGTQGAVTTKGSDCCSGLIGIINGTSLVCQQEAQCSSYPTRYCQNNTDSYGICVNYNETGSLLAQGKCDTIIPVASNSTNESFLSCIPDKWRGCDVNLDATNFLENGICTGNDICETVNSTGGKNDSDNQPDTLVANITCSVIDTTAKGCFDSKYDGRTCLRRPDTRSGAPVENWRGIIAGNKSGGAGGNGDDASPCCTRTVISGIGIGDYIYGNGSTDSSPYEGCKDTFPKDGLTCVSYLNFSKWDGIQDDEVGISINSTSCVVGLVALNVSNSSDYLNSCSGNENGTCDTNINLTGYVPDGVCYNTNNTGNILCETGYANGSSSGNCVYRGKLLPHGQNGSYVPGGNASVLCASGGLYYCIYRADLPISIGINWTSNGCNKPTGTDLICQNAGITKGLWLTTIFDGAACICDKGTDCTSGLCVNSSISGGQCRNSCSGYEAKMCSNNSLKFLEGGTCANDVDGCVYGPIYMNSSDILSGTLKPGCSDGSVGENKCDTNSTGGWLGDASNAEGICAFNGTSGVCDRNDVYYDDEAGQNGIYYTGVLLNMTNYTSELINGGGFGDSCDYNVSDGAYIAVGMAVNASGNITNVPTCDTFTRTVSVNVSGGSLYIGGCSLGTGDKCDNSTNFPTINVNDSFLANGICVNNSNIALCSTNIAARNNYTNGTLSGISLMYYSNCTSLQNNSQCDLDVSDSYFNFTNNTGTTSGVCFSGNCVLCGNEGGPVFCSDGIDNDCDGLVDVNDNQDCTPPKVTINFPLNKTYTQLPLNFNVSLESATGSVWYSLDNGINNKTMYTSSGGVIGLVFNASNASIADGNYIFRAYANDTKGNVNYTSNVNFTFDNANLTSCKNLGYSGTIYKLVQNIIITSLCFNITAANVTFDGNGFDIVNSSFRGTVFYSNSYNTTIKNVNISIANGTGIEFFRVNNGTVYNNTIKGVRWGVYLNGSLGSNILSNRIFTNGTSNNYGIYLFNSSLGNVNSNNISTGGTSFSNYGIFLQSNSSLNNIGSNTISTNGISSNYGIYLQTSSLSNNINSNNISTGGTSFNNYGIYLQTSSSSNNITLNVISTRGTFFNFGIYLSSSPSNNINSNNISTSGIEDSNDGIALSSSSSNNINSNTVSTNGTFANMGISLFSSSSNNIINSNNFSTSGSNSSVFYFIPSPPSYPSNNNLTNNNILNFTKYQLFFNGASINGTYLIDQPISNYSFTGTGGIVNFKDSRYGEIKFLQTINGSGTNLSNDVRIGNNSVSVNSSGNLGLNKYANITLYGIGNRGFVKPKIFKDGIPCSLTICNNFTALNATNVTFNVISWTNYSIGEIDAISPMINFVNPTPNNASTVGGNFIVNISSNDTNQHYTILEMNKDLALWMRMDDVNGSGSPVDISSYSRNGSLMGNAFIDVTGKFGNGLELDGNGDFVDFPDTQRTIPDGSNFTISAWVYPKSDVLDRVDFFGMSAGSDNRRGYTLTTDSLSPVKYTGRVGNSSKTTYIECGDGVITLNKWDNLVVTFDGTTLLCYKNGISGGSRIVSNDLTGVYPNTGISADTELIGGRFGSGSSAFNGSIDDVIVFTRALSAGEVGALYNATANQYINNFINLQDKGTYNFTGYAVDIAGNKNQTETRTIKAETGENVTACRDLDRENMSYKLMNDVSTTGTCFNILAHNVTLDGNGKKIIYGNQSSATAFSGISVNGYNYLTIKNLSVSKGTASASNDSRYGIYLANSGPNIIKDITASTNYYGIYLNSQTSSGSDFNNINVNNNLIGINNNGFRNLNFNNITANNNSNAGIYLLDATFNSIYNLTAYYNNLSMIIKGGGGFSESNTINLFDINYGGIGLVVDSSFNNVIQNGRINSSSRGNAIEITALSFININYFSNITVSNTNKSFYDFKISTAGINGTYLNDMPQIGNYSFASGGNIVYFNDSRFGEIKFLQGINGSGTNLTNDIRIGNNSVSVESANNEGLNKSANITLYNIGNRGFASSMILRDGKPCGNLCNNFTALNATNVIFNVTSWTSYSIGDSAFLIACSVLNKPNIAYMQMVSIISTTSPCFNVTAANITFDGNGFDIVNASFKGTVFYSNSYNTTIKNVNISIANGTGIEFFRVNNGTIYNNTIRGVHWGMFLNGSLANGILSNRIFTNGTSKNYGIYLFNSSLGNINSNIISTNGTFDNYGIYLFNSLFGNINSNNVSTFGTSDSNYGIYLQSNSSSNNINSNNISTGGSSINNYGINLVSSSSNNITSNSIFTNGTSNNYGINLVSSSSNNITSNSIFTKGTSSDIGFYLLDSSSNNIINSNNISTSGGTNSHVFFIQMSSSYPSNNNLINNTILGFTGSQLFFADASINGTYLIDQPISIYNFTGTGGIVNFKDSRYGEIKFLKTINGSGTNLSNDVRIGNNSVTVMSNVNSGLNKSANITLYGIGERGFSNIAILRDGKLCPTGVCKNFTALNATNVIFNVTSWTNYSIGNGNTAPNINYTYPTPSNATTQNGTSIYVNVSISDIDNDLMYGFTDFSKSLAAWWRLDNSSSVGENDTRVIDWSGNGNNGTVINTKVNKTGKFGGAFEFNGSVNSIAFGSGTNLLRNVSSASISVWIKPNLNSIDMIPVDIGAGAGGGSRATIEITPSSEITVGGRASDLEVGLTTVDTIGASLVSGEWHHVVGVIDYANNDIKIYINGIVKSTTAISSPGFTAGRTNNTSPLEVRIGSDTNPNTGKFNGTIDEVLVFSRSLSLQEVRALYNTSVGFFNNYTNLKTGNYTIKSYAVDAAGNMNSTEQRNIGVVNTNMPPNTPTPKINSTDGSNKTKQDLNCFDIITDNDNNTMNVSVTWYNNSLFKFQFDYNSSYANGTWFNASLGDGNTTKGENWSCALRYYDGQEYTNWVNSTNLTILNSLPNVTLILPLNGNTTIDRAPTFNWSVVDDDGDTVSSQFNLTCYSGCSNDNRFAIVAGAGNVTYKVTGDLQYLIDDLYYYNWSVRANDSAVGFSSWTNDFRLNIQSYVAINLTTEVVNFGSIIKGSNDTTTGGSPFPFVLVNTGNVFVNVTMNATDLWSSVKNPNQFYQFKADNFSGQEGAFNWLNSKTIFTNAPNSSNILLAIVGFNYTNNRNTAEVDINITVPLTEGAGVKSSTITFVASRT